MPIQRYYLAEIYGQMEKAEEGEWAKWEDVKDSACEHFFYINEGTTVVRCVHCGMMFPFEDRRKKS